MVFKSFFSYAISHKSLHLGTWYGTVDLTKTGFFVLCDVNYPGHLAIKL